MQLDAHVVSQVLSAAAVAATSLIAAWVVFRLLRRTEAVLARRTSSHVDDSIVRAITGPVVVLVSVQGLFVATLFVDGLTLYRDVIHSLWGATIIGFLAAGVANALNVIIGWYAQGRVGGADRQIFGPLRRFVLVAIYGLAAVIVLDQMGISISPLLAGLGIGGLAVALALQPTLSNFFAGTYLVSDKVARRGDFIELEGGLMGYVQDVGWRSTRIRTPYNNLVIIPNSRLADSLVINYDNPSPSMGVLVTGGVSYANDLAYVRSVSIEAAKEVVMRLEEADRSFEPWFGYDNLGDSNVSFWVWVQARSRIGSFALKSALVEELHRRFRQEGIQVNYPIRQLVSEPALGSRGRSGVENVPVKNP